MKKVLLYLILIMAVAMAGTVAYVSVSGLLKVFTGAGTLGLMLFSAIEIAKIVATSAIHTYGKKIGWFYNSLLSIAILISMAITSMGIYGFLSSSYKESFAKMENIDNQVKLLESKRDAYKKQIAIITTEKEGLNATVTELTKGLANNVIQYKDKETGQIITTTSSKTRKVLEKQLDNAISRQKKVNTKSEEISSIVFDLENEILETKLGNDAANELSTLKYLSDITGKTMDEVMKWFILLLIIIGDPMAVLMVIVFNKVVNKDEEDKLDNDTPKPRVKDNKVEVDLKYDVEHKDEDIYIRKDKEKPSNIETIASNSDYVKQIQDKAIRDIPIKDDILNEAANEVVNDNIEPQEDIQKQLQDSNDKLEEALNKLKEIDKPIEVLDNTPEEQIEENVEEVKQLKREPIVPRGKIIEEDLIKNKDRGFSVDVPDPKVTKIGSQKEVHEDKPNIFFFKRKRGDELGDN
jgi:hypothetical protein